ncbi:MAG TPA: response regulator [Stellaceae bacterium]|nr:response regulator [Stellaceae bacterium]
MDQEGVPVLLEAPEAGAARPDPPPGWGNPSNRNKIVLCVDDVAPDLRLLRQCIMSGGFTFVGAANGVECLKIVSRIEPRLILLDVNAPALDGFELCRRLRGNMRLSHVPIAFITARNSPDDVKRGLAVGGNDYILKPVSIARLRERIHHWTSRRLSTEQILGVPRDRAAPQAEAPSAEADAGPA